jgi:uncharacterized membrane protein
LIIRLRKYHQIPTKVPNHFQTKSVPNQISSKPKFPLTMTLMMTPTMTLMMIPTMTATMIPLKFPKHPYKTFSKQSKPISYENHSVQRLRSERIIYENHSV